MSKMLRKSLENAQPGSDLTDIFRIVEKSSKQVLFRIFQTDSQKD